MSEPPPRVAVPPNGFRTFLHVLVNTAVAGLLDLRRDPQRDRDLRDRRRGRRPTCSACRALGERVRLTPAGLEPIEGVVDLRDRLLLGVRTAHGLHRVVVDDLHHVVSTTEYLFGVPVDRGA